MIYNIRAELITVAVAVLTGIILRLGYACLQCVRCIYRHPGWLIHAEDFLFWIGAAVYVFVQIYYTNDGVIRLDFVLGIVVGSCISEKMLRCFQKRRKKNLSKNKNKIRK